MGTTKSLLGTEHYDHTKVAAILNQIAGWDSGRTKWVGRPAIFGMNFQAVRVGQRLIANINPDGTLPSDPQQMQGGYLIDAENGTPVPSPLLEEALDHTDASPRKNPQRGSNGGDAAPAWLRAHSTLSDAGQILPLHGDAKASLKWNAPPTCAGTSGCDRRRPLALTLAAE